MRESRNLLFLGLWLVAPLLLAQSGCTILSSAQGMASRTVEALRPESFDDYDPASEVGDPWIQQAGTEARGDRPREKVVDPFKLRNIFMSPKARDIEKNLGIGN